VPVGWRSINTPLTLPCNVRWLVRSIKRKQEEERAWKCEKA
jgi:hypothetical protein